MEIYADRIFATYNWTEENMSNQYDKNYEKVDLNVTVEIVTGEVVDIIYQIWPIDKSFWYKTIFTLLAVLVADQVKYGNPIHKLFTNNIILRTLLYLGIIAWFIIIIYLFIKKII